MSRDSLIGTVVIGRNEGARLVACLNSIPENVTHVVYVDSGSTDESIAQAEQAGATVVQLDMTQPFTAARARNTGFQKLVSLSDVEFVQFVDGDCALQPGWFKTAQTFLKQTPNAAIVCGRRRERFPERTVFNRLCDMEWDTPIGQADACGGDAMVRVAAFEHFEGFRDTMIAGEEPELCVRLRAQGWQVWRLDAEMTLHDADMTRFDQWWRRARRSGHAFAEGAFIHGAAPERHSVRAVRRILLWGAILPLALFFGATIFSPWLLLGLVIYPLQVFRIAHREGWNSRVAWEYAFFLVLGKFPEALGILEFHVRRWRGKPAGIIEYK
ncbi:glycosyltransferase [Ruegeria arenilitoris]|uniref:glycosyltransferase n=1 Tax=Ruegeria arenilitoris TaxID=1173585 RepID=UPI00147BE904|nr:glycosyltransferase family 2 protein [Ruegeria arenilitoris]